MTQLRAVIYARYSSDLQREASIEDQNEVCRRYIASMGWTLVNTFADPAMSGASRHRPAYQALIVAARAGKFDVVVCEAIDRLGRRLADTADLQDTLSFLGIRLYTPSLGEITALHVGIMGMMAQLTLKDIADKTKRGQLGRVRQGKMPSGLAYGYRITEQKGEDGGHREIEPEQARIINRIFAEYAGGKAPEKIARDLNAEHVPGPYGRVWSNTTIRGQAKRGNGILNNETYVGKINWNRCSYVKNPSTGKRVARPNPPDKWEIAQVPQLRIVDDVLWNDVKRRQFNIRQSLRGQAGLKKDRGFNTLNATHRPRFLLSGLMKCAECGGNFVVTGKDRYSCSTRHRKGTCSSRVSITGQSIESRVLVGLKERLVTPELIDTFVREFQAEYTRLQAERITNRKQIAKKLDDIDRKLKAMTKAVEDGFYHSDMKTRLGELMSEKTALTAQLEPASSIDQVAIHPRLHELYYRKVQNLERMLAGDNAEAARETVRSMIEKVTIAPEVKGYMAVLHGDLASILAISQASADTINPKEKLPDTQMSGSQLSVVAGARFELTTFRL
jgi:site-specific DNA recombinase